MCGFYGQNLGLRLSGLEGLNIWGLGIRVESLGFRD